jgi:hypothetical protein
MEEVWRDEQTACDALRAESDKLAGSWSQPPSATNSARVAAARSLSYEGVEYDLLEHIASSA